MMSVITNVEPDHMEHYEGDVRSYHQAFIEFLHNLLSMVWRWCVWTTRVFANCYLVLPARS